MLKLQKMETGKRDLLIVIFSAGLGGNSVILNWKLVIPEVIMWNVEPRKANLT